MFFQRVCARFGRAGFPRVGERGKINAPLLGDWSSFCQPLVTALLVSTWIHIRRGHRHSGQRPSRPAVYLPSRDRAPWVGGRRWRLSRRRRPPKRASFYFSLSFFFWEKICASLDTDMLVAKWEPAPCYRDAYSVNTPQRAW